MPIPSQAAIPPPADFSEFENLCCDLWRRIWQDPTAQRNGRRGQSQHGVDVFGREKGRPVGLQCKTKDELTGSKLAIGEIKRVVAEAEEFEPSLSCFTVATTALRDATLQKKVRELSELRQAQGKFSITVQFWDDIRAALGGHEDLLQKYYSHFFLAADLPVTRASSREEVEEYCSSLVAELERNLDPWIDLSVSKADEPISFDEIRASIRRGERFVLIGPSGAGKSHLVKHLARDLGCEGCVPIVASAKHFYGSFDRFLNEAVSHLTPCSAAALLRGSQDRDIPVTLVVDGLNEAAENAKGSIINGLLAVAIRNPFVSLGVTSRDETEVLHRLNGAIFRVALPDQQQRDQLSSIYNVAPEVLERWSPVLRSPLDFKLAGGVAGASVPAPLNEYGFLHAYLRKKLRERSEVGFSFLSRLSGIMAEGLMWALPQTEVLRIARGTTGGESLVRSLIDDAVLAESSRHISFWHERFQHFFIAENLLAANSAAEALAAQVVRPRYRDALPLVIGAIEDATRLRSCLEGANSQELLRAALRGDLGVAASAFLDAEAKRVLGKAEAELNEFTIVSVSSEPLDWPRIEVVETSEWSPLEASVLGALGHWIRTGRYFAQFFDLLLKSEDTCVRQLERKLTDATGSAYDITFRYLATFAAAPPLGVATLLTSVRSSFASRPCWGGEATDELIRRLENVGSQTPIVLYLLCSFLKDTLWSDDGSSINVSVVPRLLRTCKSWGIYHLALEVAEVAEQINRRVPESVANEVVDELESWLGESVSLNGAVLEAISCYKPLDITTVDNAVDKIRGLLAGSRTPESNARAASIFYLQFETVFEGTYFDALRELSSKESLEFYVRAALGADRDSLFGTSLLLRLLEYESLEAQQALERWAAPPVKTNLYSDSLGGGFLLAHLGLARLRLSLPDYTATYAEEAAWCEWGRILYWMHRADLSERERRAECRGTWERLNGELLRAAIDPWYWITRSTRSMKELESLEFVPISSAYREQLRDLLEKGLQRARELTTIFDHVRVGDRTRAIISCLGAIGNESTGALLESWCDSEEFGMDAIGALRAIRGRLVP